MYNHWFECLRVVWLLVADMIKYKWHAVSNSIHSSPANKLVNLEFVYPIRVIRKNSLSIPLR